MTPEAVIASFPRPTRRVEQPGLLLVGGLPASGKSWVARRVAALAGAAHIASDDVRMHLTDGHPTYSGPESGTTHATVRAIATRLLAEGHPVIVDATSLTVRDRAPVLRLAGRSAIAWCEADEPTAVIRLQARAAGADPDDRSEADAAVRARMATRVEPPTARESDVIRVTPATVDAAITGLAAMLAQG